MLVIKIQKWYIYRKIKEMIVYSPINKQQEVYLDVEEKEIIGSFTCLRSCADARYTGKIGRAHV